MTSNNVSNCPKCGGVTKYYDNVSRIVRQKGGVKQRVKVKRFRCVECKHIRRELPDYIHPFKHYEVEIIKGVLEGFITPDTIGFEDYPCEMTMVRWTRNLQAPL